MLAAETFLFYLFAAATPLSLAAINAAQGGLSLFFLFRCAKLRVRFGPPQWALLAFFAWNALCALASPHRYEALVGVLDYWSWTPFLVAGAMPWAVRARSSQFAGFLAFSACMTLPMDLAQFFLGTDFNHGQRLFRDAPVGTVNAYGYFSHHLTYAGMVSLVLFVAAGFAVFRRGARRWWWTSVGALAAALVTTMARTYLLAAFPAAVVLLARKGRKWALGAAVLAVLLGASLLLTGPQKLRDRAASLWDLSHPSNAERIYLWVAGGQMVAERPLLGWGPGIYPLVAEPFKEPYASRIHYPDRVGFRTVSHCHNLYLMLLIYSGVPGLALFLLFVLLALRALARQPDPALRYGVAAAFTAFLFGGLFEFNGGDAEVATLAFFLLGLGCAPNGGPTGQDPSDALAGEPALG